MTSATIPGLDNAPTKHAGLLSWVREVAELTGPDRVVFADGSVAEYQHLHRVECTRQAGFLPGPLGAL
jgi:phosphoenolpyruvate carboxykinase (GTP)